jgi:hypothetical protein
MDHGVCVRGDGGWLPSLTGERADRLPTKCFAGEGIDNGVSARNRRPSNKASDTKSIDQYWFGAKAASCRSRSNGNAEALTRPSENLLSGDWAATPTILPDRRPSDRRVHHNLDAPATLAASFNRMANAGRLILHFLAAPPPGSPLWESWSMSGPAGQPFRE